MLLPVTFHQTFIPERRYIAALLGYAALGLQGTLSEISEHTRIPMGKSSGKALATLDYARGMGLVELADTRGRSIRRPVLTPFGNTVFAHDRFMGEQVTQWLAHMNLCCPCNGAVAWHEVFAKGRAVLGHRFTLAELEAYLAGVFGEARSRTGPLVRAYLENEALAKSAVLNVDGDVVIRQKAPLLEEYAIPYSAYVLSLMDCLFPGQNQVTLMDFNARAFWFNTCLWSHSDIEAAFAMIEHTGYISVDRQMQPWIIERRASANEVWPLTYSEIA